MQIICGSTHCGYALGMVDISIRGSNPHPVWYIQPGWYWKQGILEFGDNSMRAERQLLHEFGRDRLSEGVKLAREANLPICVRCPKCHRPRWIPPDVFSRRLGAARQPAFV